MFFPPAVSHGRWRRPDTGSRVNHFLLLILLVAGVSGVVFTTEWLLERRRLRAVAGDWPSDAEAFPLPARYRQGVPISSAPMPGAADLVFDADGSVAWDQIWGNFCDLALAGGPPHRDTPLEPALREEVCSHQDDYLRVLDELERGLSLITHWPVERNLAPGWIGLVCPDEEAAYWLLHAVVAENVAAGRMGNLLLLPAGPDFRLKYEIKNVITAVAKTHHYWTEHLMEQQGVVQGFQSRAETSRRLRS
jgi:sirohydrochlorin cobaltochelatase